MKKEWRCLNCSTVLGHTVKNGSGETVLEVGDFRIDGHAIATCPECGKKRSWIPGEEALNNLLEHRKQAFCLDR